MNKLSFEYIYTDNWHSKNINKKRTSIKNALLEGPYLAEIDLDGHIIISCLRT